MRKIILAVAALAAASLAATPADAAKRKKPRQAPHAADLWRTGGPAYSQQPARMIEVRPGKWISSYGCYTDDGYGRISTCDMNDGVH